jgi:hypothetical protein
MSYAQTEYTRKQVDVPKVTGKITIDGKMNEADWSKAAQANILTANGSEGFFNKYYDFGEALTEPDYKEIYGRMLWDKDTLYLFYHVQEVVNDSMVLYFGKKFEADQVLVGLSNRQGIDTLQKPWDYNGSPFTAPDGPYLYFVLGKNVTLNGGDSTDVPEAYRRDSTIKKEIFDASKYARWAATIDTLTGIYEIEMAIYSPGINAQSKIGFNLGGSNGQRKLDFYEGDRTYEYYAWQPNVPNDPYKDPIGEGKDPGYYNLVISKHWAILNFLPGASDTLVKKVVNVPPVQEGALKIDGKMNEAEWNAAAQANILTANGSEGFFNKYYDFGEALTEPDYKEIYGRMLWSKDTLYLFYHLQEVVNDSMVLYFGKKFEADQVLIGLSDRQGIDTLQMPWDYNGSPFSAPDGPYIYFALGKNVTLNGGDSTDVPDQFVKNSVMKKIFNAADYARWAANIDTVAGTYDLEMAIYNPNIAANTNIGFNLGGSNGQRKLDFYEGDRTYEYYAWQPNVANDPYKDPVGEGKDPGYYNLVISKYWPVLNFVTQPLDVRKEASKFSPSRFGLEQNYPNPFNPSTTIRFEVPQVSKVTIKIYNVVGQVVTTLVNGQVMSAGRYEVSWDASRLASGVYFYNLEAGNVHLTKKMMLLK